MLDTRFVILYVAAPQTSAAFYADLVGAPIVENSPAFAMLPLKPDLMLGLWARENVEPVASFTGGGAEIVFAVADAQAVRNCHEAWIKKGLRIAQAPIAMDFGDTFTALDPDGHRLRVYAPIK